MAIFQENLRERIFPSEFFREKAKGSGEGISTAFQVYSMG
jgi:hypothetical protein